jgi:hypothetical protein
MGGNDPPAGLPDWDAVDVERMRERQATLRIVGIKCLFCSAI